MLVKLLAWIALGLSLVFVGLGLTGVFAWDSLGPEMAKRLFFWGAIPALGLFVHVTAGFGDVGFCGFWTLEMFAVQPVKIYPGVPICQIFFHQIAGEITEYVSDKYQHNRDIQPSLLFRELAPDDDAGQQLQLEFAAEQAAAAELFAARPAR